MNWVYPAEDEDPWFDTIERFFKSIDVSSFSLMENIGLFLTGGGTISWAGAGNVFSWDGTIYIYSPYTGVKISISSGSVSVPSGGVAYVTIPRYAQSATGFTTVTMSVGNVLPKSDTAFLIGWERNDIFYLRNGLVLTDGVSINNFNAGIPPYRWRRYQITVGTNGDSWVDRTQSATSQGGLSSEFPSVMPPFVYTNESVDVYVNGSHAYYTSDVTGKTSDYWTWVTTGSPEPVIQFGSTTTQLQAGDIVTVKYPASS
jgi:hypothetical protein